MRQDKTFLLEEVKEQIERHGSFVLAEYSEITANSMGEFRDTIAALGGDVHMVKKRIFIKAAAEAGVDFDPSLLKGHLGIIFSGDDAVETTKAVVKFSKETDKSLTVLGGRIDNQLYNADEVVTLSTLPGMQEMRAQLLAVLQAPMQQTVGVMQSLVTSVLYCLQNKCEKESE